jgi:hypothetical protein
VTDEVRIRFKTGVEASWGWWPAPPSMWSYSSLKEMDACPRRWMLTRAEYPDLWDRRGYPIVPGRAALFGDVVHGALETIVEAFSVAGCASPQAKDSVEVLRSMGGLTAIVEHALDNRMSKLDGHPRLDAQRLQRLRVELTDRLPEARAQVGTFLRREGLALGVRTSRDTQSSDGRMTTGVPPRRQPVGLGAHPEVEVTAEDLRFTGRIDLLSLDDVSVTIVDYKTGSEDPAHGDQLRTYALLWELDRETNPAARLATHLVVAYAGREHAVPAPTLEELRALEQSLVERIAVAEAEIVGDTPNARPSDDVCRFCQVRQLCDDYWEYLPPNPMDVREGEWFDFEGTVESQNGIRSWLVKSTRHGKGAMLLRTSSPSVTLPIGGHVRVLGVRRDTDPDDLGTVIGAMSANSELFSLFD